MCFSDSSLFSLIHGENGITEGDEFAYMCTVPYSAVIFTPPWGVYPHTLMVDPIKPYLVQESGTYLLYKPMFCHFCVQYSDWLPWQQGSFWGKFELRHSIGRPRKPPVWCKERACSFNRI